MSSYSHGAAKLALYPRSLPILTSLAKFLAQPALPDPASSRDDYVDHGMTILGMRVAQMDDMVLKKDHDNALTDLERRVVGKIDALETTMHQRFEEVDKRFDSLELRMNRKFDALEERLEARFQKMDARFEKIEARLDRMEGQINNFQAIQRNGKRFKLYHRIEIVRAWKFSIEHGRCQWTDSPDFPKHLKALRDMGNHAKGRWTAEELTKLSPSQRETKQARALGTLERLLNFFGVPIYTDDQSESDATEIALFPSNVDEHMEALADEWGLEWHDISRIPDEDPNILAAKKRGSLFWQQGRNVRERGEE